MTQPKKVVWTAEEIIDEHCIIEQRRDDIMLKNKKFLDADEVEKIYNSDFPVEFIKDSSKKELLFLIEHFRKRLDL